MPKYKVGDTFKATLRIGDEEQGTFYLHVEELDCGIDEWMTKKELDEAFNPAIRHQKLLERKNELAKEMQAIDKEFDKLNQKPSEEK